MFLAPLKFTASINYIMTLINIPATYLFPYSPMLIYVPSFVQLIPYLSKKSTPQTINPNNPWYWMSRPSRRNMAKKTLYPTPPGWRPPTTLFTSPLKQTKTAQMACGTKDGTHTSISLKPGLTSSPCSKPCIC
jgi:hypothetical protein